MLAGEGLHPSSKGCRIRFSGKDRAVIDGPFAETKELIAGFWMWKVDSMEHAIEWLKRCPNPHYEECEVEIRPVFEMEDFGDAMTDELREQEERIRAQLEASATGDLAVVAGGGVRRPRHSGARITCKVAKGRSTRRESFSFIRRPERQ